MCWVPGDAIVAKSADNLHSRLGSGSAADCHASRFRSVRSVTWSSSLVEDGDRSLLLRRASRSSRRRSRATHVGRRRNWRHDGHARLLSRGCRLQLGNARSQRRPSAAEGWLAWLRQSHVARGCLGIIGRATAAGIHAAPRNVSRREQPQIMKAHSTGCLAAASCQEKAACHAKRIEIP